MSSMKPAKMRTPALRWAMICMGALVLQACAAVFTDASDANHVTFLNSANESLAQLTEKANAYCQQYGKKAIYRKGDNLLIAVFDCR